jgi:hypothetical protein
MRNYTSRERILVYEIKLHGSKIITTDPKVMAGIVECDMDLSEDNVGLKATIEVKQMTQKQYEEMPEFEGY